MPTLLTAGSEQLNKEVLLSRVSTCWLAIALQGESDYTMLVDICVKSELLQYHLD